MRLARGIVLWSLVAVPIAVAGSPARAEAAELRISKGYGIHYLPLYVMEKQRLLEKHAAAAGLMAAASRSDRPHRRAGAPCGCPAGCRADPPRSRPTSLIGEGDPW